MKKNSSIAHTLALQTSKLKWLQLRPKESIANRHRLWDRCCTASPGHLHMSGSRGCLFCAGWHYLTRSKQPQSAVKMPFRQTLDQPNFRKFLLTLTMCLWMQWSYYRINYTPNTLYWTEKQCSFYSRALERAKRNTNETKRTNEWTKRTSERTTTTATTTTKNWKLCTSVRKYGTSFS